MPNYNPDLKTIMHTKAFPSHIPVLIGSLPYDSISALPDMIAMNDHLRSKRAQIEHVVCEGADAQIMHGQIGKARGWQEAIDSFLIKHNLRKGINEA